MRKLIATASRSVPNTTLLLALAGGAVLLPSALAAAPGNYGSIKLNWQANASGYAGFTPDGGTFWKFDGPSSVEDYVNSQLDVRMMQFKVTEYKTQPVTQLAYGFCGEYSKALTKNQLTTLTYELVPVSSIGYYSGVTGGGAKFNDAKGVSPNGIGVEKAKLLQALADTGWNQATMLGNNVAAAGFQLAIWKIVAEDFTAGLEHTDTTKWSFNQVGQTLPTGGYMGVFTSYPTSGDALAIVGAAQNFLNAALAEYTADIPTPDADVVKITAVTMASHDPVSGIYFDQDLLFFTPVPEPQTYALAAGFGLLGFGLYRRSRRQG